MSLKGIAAGVLLPALSLYGLDLNEAITKTIENNPSIKERMNNYNAVREDLHYARGAYFPTLDVTVGTGSENAKNALQTDPKRELSVTEQKVTLSYNLFNGYGDSYTTRQQKARLQAAAYSYMEEVDRTLLLLIEHYINILRHKALMVVEKDNIKMDEKIYDDMLGKQKQGLQRLSDLKEARSKLALAYTNHLSAENNIQDTLVNFHKLFGRYVTLKEISETQFQEQLPNTIEEITQIALENNPSIKVASFEKMATMHAYRASRSSYWPKVDLELSDSVTENVSGIEGETTNTRAVVYLTYNLFNGFSDRAYTQKKVSEMHQKDQQMHQVKRDVIETIQLAWNAFRITSKQTVFIKWYVQSSKDKLNSYYKEFNIGRRSLIDLLGASDDYNNARRKMINTKYDLMFARYRLLAAMGELTQTLGIDAASRVGLNARKAYQPKEDSSELSTDRDGDKIPDSEDLCDNSERDANLTDAISHYGCQETIRSNNSDFKALESFLNESIKNFVKESDEIEGWD